MGLTFAVAITLTGCSSDESAKRGPGGGGKAVGYILVQRTNVPLDTELAGRVSAYQTSQVRPQISGVIRRRLFKEGALVRAGQPLYEIDPATYRAAQEAARANLQSAVANAAAAKATAERYKPLVKIEAVSQQDYTNAVATAQQAAAAVAQSRALLDQAKINMRYTTVPAPISGRIGRSLSTVGALVTANQADPLAQINRLDPVYVDIQQSAANMLTLRRELAKGSDDMPDGVDVRLKLADGSDYGATGHIEFAESIVDPSTGTVTLRARFANPHGLLLPGMFVRARFAQTIQRDVYLVPQVAISRDGEGAAHLFIVGKDNKAVDRTVTAPRTQGIYWVVTSGLRPGDKIITQGTGNLHADQAIKPVPADTPQEVRPAGAAPAKAG